MTFWALSMFDLYVPSERYEQELNKLKQQQAQLDDNKDMVSSIIKVNGCLPFVRKIRLVWPLYNGKGFSEYADQPEEIALTIKLPYWTSTKTARRSLKGPGNRKLKQMVRKFPTFRSERKKRTTSGGSPQFLNGFSRKLPFHLTLNRNFRNFLAKW